MLKLNEDQSFSLTANVTSQGYQTVALKGYLVSERSDGTYMAPLIPQLFYGVDGNQLQTWRQYFSETGSQVILSRKAGGYPEVPREDLYWRKISEAPEKEIVEAEPPAPMTLGDWWNSLPTWQKALAVLTVLSAAGTLYYLGRKR